MSREVQARVVELANLAEHFGGCARAEVDVGNLRNADWYVQLAQSAALSAFALVGVVA
jgi:hypothetical protein